MTLFQGNKCLGNGNYTFVCVCVYGNYCTVVACIKKVVLNMLCMIVVCIYGR